MSAKLTGLVDLSRVLAELPSNLERNVLRGALRAGAEVFAEGAREGCRSSEVRASIKTSSRSQPGLVTAKIQTKGPGAYMAPWLEFGTDPHFISVDSAQSGGRTIKRINRDLKHDSLVIGGRFVGDTVFHPGARAFPFMRPAIDTRETAAIAAISGYIAKKATKAGLEQPAEIEPDE